MANRMGEIDILLSVLRQIADRIGPDQCNRWFSVPVSGKILGTSTSPFVLSPAALPNLLFRGTEIDANVQAAHLDHFWAQKAPNVKRVDHLSHITSIHKSRILEKQEGGKVVAIAINFSDQADCDKRWIQDDIETSWEGLPSFARGAANICNSVYNRRLPTIDNGLITAEVEKYIVDSDYEHYVPPQQSSPELNVVPDDSGDTLPSGDAPQPTSGRPLIVTIATSSGSPSNVPAIVTPRTDEQSGLVSDAGVEGRGHGGQIAFHRHRRVEATARSSLYNSSLKICVSEQKKDEMKNVPPSENEMRYASYVLSRYFNNGNSSSVPLPHVEGRTGELRHATMMPIKRSGKYEATMVLEIVGKIFLMVEHCGVDVDLVLQKLGKSIDPTKHFLVLPRMTREEEIDFTIGAMNILNTTGARWHELRMYVENVFLLTRITKVKFGSPLIDVRMKRRAMAPRKYFYHGSSQFRVSGGDSRTCRFWYARNPMQIVALLFEDALNNREYEPSSNFCGASDSFAVVVTNIDRDTGTIGFIVRLANWTQGNSAHKCRTWAEIDSASECYENLSKFLRTAHDGFKKDLGVDYLPANPIHTVSQALYDDKIVEASYELELKSGKSVWVTTCILSCCKDGQDVSLANRSPDTFPESLQEVEVDNEQYLRDSPLAHTKETASFFDLRLLIEQTSKAPIGIGTMDPDSGEILTWSTFSSVVKDVKAFEGAKVKKNVFRRIIGADSSDGKMALILQGSAGASSTYNCPKCLFRNHDGMDNIGKTFPLRRGAMSPETCYDVFSSAPAPVTAAEKKERSLDSFSITKQPIFRMDPSKIFGGTMHWRMGNAEKIDGCSVSALNCVERESVLHDFAQEESDLIADATCEVETMLIRIQDDIGERRNGISDMKKRIKEVQKKIEDDEGTVEDDNSLLQQQMSILKDDETSLRPLENSCLYLQKYSKALDHAAADLDSYLGDGDDRSGYLVLLLNEAYLKAANVPFQGYFGGRTLIGRHVERLLQRYPLICKFFFEAIQERCDDFFPIDLIEDVLQDAAECMVELDIIAVFAESQGKISTEEKEELVESLKRYEEALKNNYPDCHVSTKMHSYLAHLVETFDHWASVGRFNEQGFEAVHAFTNSFRNKFIRLVDSELKADQVRQEVAARKCKGATKLIETSNSMRAKRPREQKEATKEQRAAINKGWIRWTGIDRETRAIAGDEEILENSREECQDEEGGEEIEIGADASPKYADIQSPDSLPNDGPALRELMLCPDCDECVFKHLYLFHRTGRHGDCPNFHHLPEPLPEYDYSDNEAEEARNGSRDDDQGSLSSDGENQSDETHVVIKSIKKSKGHMPMLIAELEARGVELSPSEKKKSSTIGPLFEKLQNEIGEGVETFKPTSPDMIELIESGDVDVVQVR